MHALGPVWLVAWASQHHPAPGHQKWKPGIAAWQAAFPGSNPNRLQGRHKYL